MPRCDADLWIDPLNAAMDRFEINTPMRMAAFLAQLAHESTETTNPSLKVFSTHAPSVCAWCGRNDFRHQPPLNLT